MPHLLDGRIGNVDGEGPLARARRKRLQATHQRAALDRDGETARVRVARLQGLRQAGFVLDAQVLADTVAVVHTQAAVGRLAGRAQTDLDGDVFVDSAAIGRGGHGDDLLRLRQGRQGNHRQAGQ